MLLTFSVKNFKSFKDEAILDLRAASIDEYDEINTFEDPIEGKVLKGAYIFGGNSAGKSNLIKALLYMRKVVCNSFVDQRIFDRRGNCFLLDEDSENNPIEFNCEFKSAEQSYKYSFSIFDQRIINEKLEKKNVRYSILFERNEKKELSGNSLFIKRISKFLNVVRDDTLIVSVLSALANPECKIVYDWFDNIITPDPIELLDLNDVSDYLDYVKLADKTIIDVSSKMEGPNDEERNIYEGVFKEMSGDFEKYMKHLENSTIHTVYDKNKNPVRDIKFSLEKYASLGTKKYLSLLEPIFRALKTGSLICIDEIDSNLHVSLVNYLISLFNSIDSNPKNAQIITTTHDVFLLDENIRRDQIILVDKDKYGESKVYSLVDLKGIKKRDKFLKKYLLGYYGAIPCIKDFENE